MRDNSKFRVALGTVPSSLLSKTKLFPVSCVDKKSSQKAKKQKSENSFILDKSLYWLSGLQLLTFNA